MGNLLKPQTWINHEALCVQMLAHYLEVITVLNELESLQWLRNVVLNKKASSHFVFDKCGYFKYLYFDTKVFTASGCHDLKLCSLFRSNVQC